MAASYQPVVFVRKNNQWLVRFSFFVGEHAVGNDDDDVAGLGTTGGGSVEADNARSALTFYDIGYKPFAVIIIHNMYLLVFQQTYRVHQVFIDGDAAHVVQLGLSDFYAVQL